MTEAIEISSLAVVGLGYVGLPLAQEACRSGISVTGFDTKESVVSCLMNGESYVDDLNSADIADMLEAGFAASGDSACIGNADVIVICVPTPLDADGTPDLGAVVAATQTVSAVLRAGTLVVLESTTYPGTTENTVKPILEAGSGLTAGSDFNLAY